MIDDGPLARFEPLDEHLLKPIYADYSFANIPATVQALLTGEPTGPLLPASCFGGSHPRPRVVVLFLIDAFGWTFWERHRRRFAALRRIGEAGVVTPISALFPSSTPGSISTLNVGTLPAQHGVYEWYQYIEAFGEVIQTLPFQPLGHHSADLQATRGYDPRLMLLHEETVYQRLARRGVASTVFVGRGYAHSAYNRMATAGATVVGYGTLAEALVALRERMAAATSPAYFYLYWGDIDAIGHTYGPGTAFHDAEIASFWRTFEAVFPAVPPAETLWLFAADHGMRYSDPRATFYLNQRVPALADHLKRAPNGALVYPNGAPHAVFLHLRDGHAAEVRRLLSEPLAGRATILSIDEVLAQGLFGPPPHTPEVRRRLGDLLILPHAGHDVWWYEPGRLENRFFGHHGGLTPDELITVLGVMSDE